MKWLAPTLLALIAQTACAQRPQPRQPRETAPTSRDTTHYQSADSTIAKQLRDEANRNQPRKAVIRALADTLERAGKALIFTTPTPPVPVNQPPVARFTMPAGGCVASQPCPLDGSTSTDDKAVTGYAWNCDVVPNCAPSGATTVATYPHAPDTRNITLTVTDSAGLTSTMTRSVVIVAGTVPPDTTTPPVPPDTTTPPVPPDTTGTGVTPPQPPKSVPDATPKPCTRSVDVAAGADLQAALASAVGSITAGGTCLELAPTGRWNGTYTLPTRNCSAFTSQNDGWITIRTKGVTDVPWTRMTQTQGMTLAAIIQGSNQMAIQAGHPTCRWQIMHLNLQRNPTYTGLVYHLLVLGDGGWSGGGEANISMATQPTDIIVRRNWIHGTVDGETVRCVVLNGIRLAVVDNWIDDCHASGFDSQAVEGWNGAGPFLIQNNFLAGAGENVMFGGAEPVAAYPADLTMLGNHVYKDPAWKGKWSVKNLYESKNLQRQRVEQNVMENTWVASQVGMGVVIKSATGTTAADAKPNQGSTDLSFRWNDLRNMHRGFNVQGTDCSAERCVDNVKVTRVAVEQNRITGIGTSNGTGPSDAWFFPTSDNPSDVLYRHNTFVGNTPGYGIHIYFSGMSGGKFQRMAWIDNVLAHQGSYAIAGDGAPGCCKAAFDYYVTGGRYDHNVVSAVEGSFQTPTGNFYTTTQAALGLTTDFALPAGSPYKGKASDGKDPGADIPALIAATSGVVVQSAMQARARQPRPAKPLPRVRYTAADSAWCRRNACLPAPRRR